MDVTQLALTWVEWPNGEKLALTCVQFDLDQSERKSSQVNASAREAWSNGDASGPKFSICVHLGLRLARPCVHLRLLAMTCIALTFVEIKFAPKSKQVFHRLATQPKSTQVE